MDCLEKIWKDRNEFCRNKNLLFKEASASPNPVFTFAEDTEVLEDNGAPGGIEVQEYTDVVDTIGQTNWDTLSLEHMDFFID
jgi:hypothetical protein